MLLWLGIIIFIIFLYRKAPFLFFQQDEWLAFARRIVLEKQSILVTLIEAFNPTVGHFNPLNFLMIGSMFSLFHLNFISYMAVSIFLHLISVVLVFWLATLLTKSSPLAILSALMFGVWASASQATTWAVADTATHWATIFGLLSLISLFKFLRRFDKRSYILMISFLMISVFFKEITIGLFILLPAAIYIYSKDSLKRKVKMMFPVLLSGAVFLGMRIFMFFLPKSQVVESVVTKTLSFRQVFINLVILPINMFSQSLIPNQPYLNTLVKLLTAVIKGYKDFFVNWDNIFIECFLFTFVSTIIFFILIIFTISVFSRKRRGVLKKNILFLFLWIFLNSLIFAFSPERTSVFYLVDSRNLYFVSVGVILLVLILLDELIKKPAIFYSVILLVLVGNIYSLETNLSMLSSQGIVRRNILNTIKKAYPRLTEKVVFYTESDSSYYGLLPEEKILPFQSGLGQTLLVWYYSDEYFPEQFYQNKFLWEIRSQGYQEFGGRGYGYFRNLELLKDNVKRYNLSPDSIYAFSWNGSAGEIKDISDKIRQNLK